MTALSPGMAGGVALGEALEEAARHWGDATALVAPGNMAPVAAHLDGSRLVERVTSPEALSHLVFRAFGEAEVDGALGTRAWGFGREGASPVVTGSDVVRVVNGRIAEILVLVHPPTG